MTVLTDFVEKHLDKPWDFSYLSDNKSITTDFIEKHMDKSWDYYYLSLNPVITISFIKFLNHILKSFFPKTFRFRHQIIC